MKMDFNLDEKSLIWEALSKLYTDNEIEIKRLKKHEKDADEECDTEGHVSVDALFNQSKYKTEINILKAKRNHIFFLMRRFREEIEEE